MCGQVKEKAKEGLTEKQTRNPTKISSLLNIHINVTMSYYRQTSIKKISKEFFWVNIIQKTNSKKLNSLSIHISLIIF